MGKGRKWPRDASIDELVDFAVHFKLLDGSAKGLVLHIKDFRDLIHPDRERRVRAKVDGATTSSVLALLRVVVRDLHAAKSDGRLDSFIAWAPASVPS